MRLSTLLQLIPLVAGVTGEIAETPLGSTTSVTNSFIIEVHAVSAPLLFATYYAPLRSD